MSRVFSGSARTTAWLGSTDTNFASISTIQTTLLSIPGNWIGLLREGKPGELWAILGVGGAAIFEQASERFTYYKNEPDNPTSLSGNILSSYVRTENRNFWFGMLDGGVSRYNPETENFTQFTASDGLASNKVNDVIQDDAGNIWVGTAGQGINKISSDSTIARKIPLQPGRYIKVSVQDNGIGIAPDHLDKIFDPYFTTKSKGSGLGLASSYSIIKRHDGHMSVESESGEGTTFHIYLPASESEEIAAETSEERLQKGSGTVLFMDDEKIIQSLGTEMLKHLGYEVETASNGEEAVAKYREQYDAGEPYDAVIMDLTIPGGMGGKEAITELLSIDPDVKAIVSSGYVQDDTMAR